MLAELRITPVGSAPPFANQVAEVLRIICESPLHYQMHAMGTTLEGELDQILDAVRRCHEELRKQSGRVLIELSLDDRCEAEGALVRSVEHVRRVAEQRPLERLIGSSVRG